MKVNRNGRLETVEVSADGEGFCSQAGALLLTNLADRLGLTEGLQKALAPTRQRRSAHQDGEVLRDLIVTLVDAKALGLSKLPFRSFQMNEAWMALALCAQDLLAGGCAGPSGPAARPGAGGDS